MSDGPGPGRSPGPDALWQAVRDDVEATEQALSRFREDAELVLLNRARGRPVRVSRRLYAALAAAERARRLTGGAFDARVLRALEELGEHGAALDDARPGGAGEMDPSGEDLRATAGSGASVCRDPRAGTVVIGEPIDLGGIGKGLALRWAERVLARSAPGAGYLLEAGGDIVCRAPAPDGPTWRVGIEDPAGGGAPLAVLAVAQGAVMTSSVAVRQWTGPDGRPVHHLLDPRTGRPVDAGLRAVTVLGADPAWCEVWTKALFLAGERAIGGLARARGLAAWWVHADGQVRMTPAARQRTLWVRAEARPLAG